MASAFRATGPFGVSGGRTGFSGSVLADAERWAASATAAARLTQSAGCVVCRRRDGGWLRRLCAGGDWIRLDRRNFVPAGSLWGRGSPERNDGMFMRFGSRSTGSGVGGVLARVSRRATAAATLTAAVAASAGVASTGSGTLSGSHIGDLYAVSCSSAKACAAVGDYTPGFDHPRPPVALAYRWNGRRWSKQHFPTVSGAGPLAGSCPSAKSCIAVGTYGEQGLVERWNGLRWMRQSAPSSPSGDLLAVSCSSANACTAVGSSNSSAWAWSWNGMAWKSQPISIPSGSYLDGVACPSAKVCFSVGFKSNGPNRAVLVERWNGAAWSEQNAPSPKPRSGGPWLASVSCPTVSSCTAVGSDGYGVLVEHWNGSRWSRQTSPLGYRNAVLDGVSCLSTTVCMAVGERNFKPLGVLAERWNGKQWSLSHALTPTSSKGQGAALSSVACRSWKVCVAVGASGDFADNVETLLAERWNGSRWHLQ